MSELTAEVARLQKPSGAGALRARLRQLQTSEARARSVLGSGELPAAAAGEAASLDSIAVAMMEALGETRSYSQACNGDVCHPRGVQSKCRWMHTISRRRLRWTRLGQPRLQGLGCQVHCQLQRQHSHSRSAKPQLQHLPKRPRRPLILACHSALVHQVCCCILSCAKHGCV